MTQAVPSRSVIVISRREFRVITDAAERTYPEECCGLLVGVRTPEAIHVRRVTPSRNVAETARVRRFQIDPALHLTLLRTLRGSGEEIVGHYHSHPDGDAKPSAEDASSAFDTSLVWLILSVKQGRFVAADAFIPEGNGDGVDRFRALTLSVAADASYL